MSVVAQVPSVNTTTEKRALHTCIERMRSLLCRTEQAGASLRIAVGDASLLVDTEHAALARGTLRSPGGKLEALVIRTLGWQAKTKHDLGRVEDEITSAAAGRLLFDAACGRLLEAEFDAMLGQGEKFLAVRWERALRTLWRHVSELSAEAGADLDPAGIEELHNRLAGRDLWTPEAPVRTLPPAFSCQPRLRADSGRSGLPRWTAYAVAVLLIFAGTASYVSMNFQSWMNRPEAGTLDGNAFAQLPSVLEFEDCPPSVFVTVDAVAWTHMDDSSRADVVSRIRQTIQMEGYQGALVYTRSGAVVAQWDVRDGVQIF